jgi:ABC-type amino acid transport substrate-binding protein
VKARILMHAVAALVASFSVSVALADDTLSRIARLGTVTLAVRESAVPFSYMAGDGKPIGYTVDICMKFVDAIRHQLNRSDLKIAFVKVTPSTRFDVIRNGEADLECGPTTNTAERRKRVGFTIANFIATAKMIAKADSGIRDWSDIRNKTIVTTAGTTNASSIAERNNIRALNIRLVEANDDSQAFQQVVEGRADAFAMDDVLLYGLRASAKAPEQFVVVGSPLTVEPYAVMFAREDNKFKRLIDLEMARIINSGEIYGMYRKWFNSPIPPKGVVLNMPMNQLLRASFQYPSDMVGD